MTGYKRIEPAFRDERKCIVFCTDNGFVPGTAVAMRSIADHARTDRNYDLIVLHSRVDRELQDKVEHMFDGESNISVRFFDVSNIVSGTGFYTGNRATLTGEAYYRLFIPWVLSENYDKALYLDGDMLIMGDITELTDMELTDELIAAVRDYWGICNCYIPGDKMRPYREKIGIKNMDEFVISATILFNLKKFREAYTLKYVLGLIGSSRWKQHDQDVLNILCMGRIKFLSPRWGYVRDYGNEVYLPAYLKEHLDVVKNDHVIHHFAGYDRKPWVSRTICAVQEAEFWRTAERTPFLDDLLSKAVYPYLRSVVLKMSAYEKRESDKGGKPSYAECFAELGSMRLRGGRLHLTGCILDLRAADGGDVRAMLYLNGEEAASVNTKREKDIMAEGTCMVAYTRNDFTFDVPLDPKVSSKAEIGIFRKQGEALCVLSNSINFPINDAFSNSYFYEDGRAATFKEGELRLCTMTRSERKKREIAYIMEMFGKGCRGACLMRLLYPVLHKLLRQPVWLVSDRVSLADDNGLAFFRYLNEKKKNEVRSYFVIKKDCSAYKKIKAVGRVLEPGSFKHRLLAVLAEAHIMSQTDNIFRRVFEMEKTPLCDLMGMASYVFLQHGILLSDASAWLARSRYAFDGFVSGCRAEYDSILNGEYGYDEKELWLTGLARFDTLEDKREKLITVMPTWRKYLTKRQNEKTGAWELRNGFEESAYARFWRGLMTDERLNKKAKEAGYELRFKLHPSLSGYVDRFGFPKDVKIFDEKTSYGEIYSKTALAVTDYSSSVVDIAFLRKPVIYCHFDKDEFFSGDHITCKGYFNYDKDGFGEVEYDIRQAADRIIEYMENDCMLKDEYRARIDRFFTFSDRNNCSRIYDRIMTEVSVKRR